MKVTVLAAALFALASPVLAQQATPPVMYKEAPHPTVAPPPLDPERVALAHKMIEILDMKSMMHGMYASMFASIRPPATATADQKARISQLLQSMSAGMEAATPQLMDMVADTYARQLTAQEMKDSLAFYGSPSGQAILHKLPALMQSVMPMAAHLMPNVMTTAEKDYCAHRTCDAADRQMFAAMKNAYSARGLQ
jgi:hypothetical protein